MDVDRQRRRQVIRRATLRSNGTALFTDLIAEIRFSAVGPTLIVIEGVTRSSRALQAWPDMQMLSLLAPRPSGLMEEATPKPS